jgi:hypothetical protein
MAQAQRRIAYGGVSGSPHGASLHNAEVLHAPLAAAATGGAFPNFQNYGGPVVAKPTIYATFWGDLWSGDQAHRDAATRLATYLADLVASSFMNVLSQYGVGTGAGSGTFVASSYVKGLPATLTLANITASVQSLIDAGTVPEPAANNTSLVLMIFLDENVAVSDPNVGGGNITMCEPNNDNAFGFHYFFTTAKGNPFYFAVVPSLDDACITQTCGTNDSGCSLHRAQTQEQRRTQVASHEFSEMCSDPQLNAWYDPNNGECGDICNGETATLTGVSGNSWNVQPQYSKHDDIASNGATYCIASAASPYPKLT